MNVPLSATEKLGPAHSVADFDCGVTALNVFLQRHALATQRSEAGQTYVACRGARVAGYYSLAAGAVEPAHAPLRVGKGLARHPVPVLILARLAVDRREQGRGLGRALLKDALFRATQAADVVGLRAMLVHAKDDRARTWYAQFDFEPSPTDPLHLFLLMKDIRKALQG